MKLLNRVALSAGAAVGIVVLGRVTMAMVANEAERPFPTKRDDAFLSLIDLAARRLLLGDEVAAAKYAAGVPVDDPLRERQLLAEVAVRSRTMGLDPAISVQFFQAQIDANKVVQRSLHELWTSRPQLRPRRQPDLATEVRPQLDAITVEILNQLKAATGSTGQLRWRTGAANHGSFAPLPGTFDELHRDALRIALAPITA